MAGTATPLRRPALRRALQHWLLAAFRELAADVAAGDDVPRALDSASGRGGVLYDWRPRYGAYVARRERALAGLADTRAAVDALRDDPAAVAFARARSGQQDPERALVRAILLPLLVAAAEGCGGFDLDDAVVDRLVGRLQEAIATERTTYAAFVPLTGIVAGGEPVELGAGVRIRRWEHSDLATEWPEAIGMLPPGYREDDTRCSGLELVTAWSRGDAAEEPDAARSFAAAVTALRLVLGGGVAAGACAFVRVDWAPRAVVALSPLLGAAPELAPVRLDSGSAGLVRALVPRIAAIDEGRESLAAALTRYGFARSGSSTGERLAGLVGTLEPLLGQGAGPWAVAMRAAALVGRTAAERQSLVVSIRQVMRHLDAGGPLAVGDAERLEDIMDGIVRTALVAALEREGSMAGLAETLDSVLLGSVPRPQVVAGVARSA